MTERPAMAVHLAAGEGTRLRPYTEDTPKPMIELGGKSLLENNLATLEAASIDEQLIVTGYKPDAIHALDYETVRNPIYDETDMVYSLFCARERFPTERDLLICYGDIVFEPAVASALLACDAPVCVVVDREWRRLWELRFDDPLSDAETLALDDGDQITAIGDPADSYDEIDAQYIGLIKVRVDHIDRFSAIYDELSGGGSGLERDSVEMTHFIQHLVDLGWAVQGVPIDGGWVEVDTVSDLERYRGMHQEGELRQRVDLGQSVES